MLNSSMLVVVCCYVAIAFFGYAKYGSNVLSSITLNLPQEEWLAQIVVLSITMSVFLSYGLQFYVSVSIMLPMVLQNVRMTKCNPGRTEFLLRVSLVLLTCK